MTPREAAIDAIKCTALTLAFLGCVLAAAIMFGGQDDPSDSTYRTQPNAAQKQ